MMDESSFHQCRSSKFHIYMSRPTWAFFFPARFWRLLDSTDSPEHWATGFPVLLRFSENDGSLQIVMMTLAPIFFSFWSSDMFWPFLRNSDIFRWFHGQKSAPQKKVLMSWIPEIWTEILSAWSFLVIYLAGTRPGKRWHNELEKSTHAIFMGKSIISMDHFQWQTVCLPGRVMIKFIQVDTLQTESGKRTICSSFSWGNHWFSTFFCMLT